MLLRVAVLAAVVALAAAQIPAMCSSPAQWDAKAMIRDGRRGQFENIFSVYSYDATNFRRARMDQVEENRTTTYYHVIELFNEKKYYQIDLKTKVCTSGELQHPWIPHAVEPNSTFRGDYIVGSLATENAGVEIEDWSHDFEHEGAKLHWEGRFTRKACVPIAMNLNGPNFFIEENFFDVTLGNEDPNVFIPPAGC